MSEFNNGEIRRHTVRFGTIGASAMGQAIARHVVKAGYPSPSRIVAVRKPSAT
jgi:hypothetical protein